MRRKIHSKLLAVLASFSLFVQVLQPVFVYAQELPSPTPTVSETPIATETPAETASPSPIDTVIPSPTEVVSATPTETPIETPVETVSPTPTDSEVLPPTPSPTDATVITETPGSQDSGGSNQSSENTSSQPPTPSVSASVAPTSTPGAGEEKIGHINAVLLEGSVQDVNSALQNLSFAVESSATLVTDKPDYAPTEVVVISGTGFTKDKEYTLLISSTDPPTVEFSTTVLTDSNGTFVYAYQLDGNYRPNYSVYIKDGSTTVASTTFTDSAFVCQNDVDGANDEPGQKDLTRMCADYSPLPTSIDVNWNWDDSAWSGGNTGDGCALFDTDSDGKVNYALCITVGGSPAAFISKQLYSCNDSKSDRCAGKIAISSSAATSCSASVQSTDPFSAGANYPDDTTGSCSVLMSDMSATTADLIDVCSYPSNEPNSDPSDCIVATNAQTGKLEIIKSLVPSTDPGLFNLSIDGAILASGVGNNGSTGEQVVLASAGSGTAHTFSESAGTGTSLSNYTISVVCKDNNGTGSVISTTGSNPWTVNVVKDKDVVCTITNTRANGTIELKKTWSGTAGQTTLNIGTTSNGTDVANVQTGSSGAAPLTTGTKTVNTGTYYVSESGGLADYGSSLACTDNASPVTPGTNNSLSVVGGHTVICTFTNTRNTGSVKVNKLFDSDGNGTFETSNPGTFTWSLDGSGTKAMGSTTTGVDTGSHSVSENSVSNDHFVGWYPTASTEFSCSNPSDTTLPVSIGVSDGQTTEITLCNARDTNSIIVYKVLLDPDGNLVEGDDHSFTVQLDGADDQSITNGNTVTYGNVVTGTHGIGELSDAEYDQLGCQLPTEADASQFTLATGDPVNVTCTNQQKKAHITVVKQIVAPDGVTDVLDSDGQFTFDVSTQSATIGDDGSHTFDVNPGSHDVIEEANTDYTFVGCQADYDGQETGSPVSNGESVTLGSGDSVTVTCVNAQKQASITVNKNVLKSDGSEVSDNHSFSTTLNAETKAFGEGADAVFSVDPGTYGATEGAETSYTLDSNDGPVTVGSNGSATIHIVNKQNAGTISGYKYQADGQTGIEGWLINLYKDCASDFTGCVLGTSTSTDSTGFYSFTNLISGFYKVLEDLVSGWTPVGDTSHDVAINPGTVSENNNFSNFKNIDITVCKKADADGSLDTTDDQSQVSGWEMTLFSDEQQVGDAQTTDRETGCTTFSDIGPGHDYSVTETPQSGWASLTLMTHDFGIPSDGVNQDYTFINTRLGSITVDKVTDPSDDPQAFDFTLAKDEETVASTSLADADSPFTFDDLLPGDYTLNEGSVSGWSPEGINCTGIEVFNNGGTIHVSAGSDITCTFHNTKAGNVTVIKFDDKNGNGVQDEGEETLSDWQINLEGSDSQTTDENGQTTFNNVLPGQHQLGETQQEGWNLTGITCSNEGTEPSPTPSPTGTPTPPQGSNNLCHKTHSAAHPWNALSVPDNNHTHENHTQDYAYNGPLNAQGHPDKTGEQWCADHVPSLTFLDLIARPAFAREVETDGNTHTVTVATGETVTCKVGNQQINPILTLTKSNDTSGNDRHPGDSVLFTLTVEATQSAVNGVTVTDLPANGFHYRSGSWTANSSVRGDLRASLITPEPTYASPGVWQLGDMVPGEVVTLTYLADIDGSEPAGLYPDVAWAEGQSLASTQVLANADTGVFVGTNVNVVVSQGGVSYNGESKVLGASTSLPATGAETIWLVLGLGSLGLGLVLIKGGFKSKSHLKVKTKRGARA